MSEAIVLAGDIGGTKSNLAFFRGDPEAPEIMLERTYPNRDHRGLVEVVLRFLADTGQVACRAAFGVAGAVVDGEASLPNLGWTLSARNLARELGLPRVQLLNDVAANALGIATLRPEQLHTLQTGRAGAAGPRALIAAGTGLGQALLHPDNGRGYRAVASEGGHTDFAPRDEEQVALLKYLAERHGHVSVERVVSGPGLVNVYEFLRWRGIPEPPELAAKLRDAEDRAALIAGAGLGGTAAIAARALDLFAAAYGAAAGNLALTALATGGVYLGGGIAPKLLPKLTDGSFQRAFADKGRFAGLLAQVPIHVILEPRTALYGAAVAGLRG